MKIEKRMSKSIKLHNPKYYEAFMREGKPNTKLNQPNSRMSLSPEK